MASTARLEELKRKFEENPRRYFAPLANEHRKAGDLDQAIALCRAHLPQQPAHISGHIVLGQALFEKQQLEESGHVFQAALGLDPENLIALRYLGDIARHMGDVPSARAWYKRVLDVDPRNEEIAQLMRDFDAPAPDRSVQAIDAAPEVASTETVSAAPTPSAEVSPNPRSAPLSLEPIDVDATFEVDEPSSATASPASASGAGDDASGYTWRTSDGTPDLESFGPDDLDPFVTPATAGAESLGAEPEETSSLMDDFGLASADALGEFDAVHDDALGTWQNEQTSGEARSFDAPLDATEPTAGATHDSLDRSAAQRERAAEVSGSAHLESPEIDIQDFDVAATEAPGDRPADADAIAAGPAGGERTPAAAGASPGAVDLGPVFDAAFVEPASVDEAASVREWAPQESDVDAKSAHEPSTPSATPWTDAVAASMAETADYPASAAPEAGAASGSEAATAWPGAADSPVSDLEVMEFVPPRNSVAPERSQTRAEPPDPLLGHTLEPGVAAAGPTPAAFVTETMAELYLQQGFRHEALAVYRELLDRNPDDASLRDRIQQIESGSMSSIGMATLSENVVESARKRQTARPARSVRSFFASLAGRRAPYVPERFAAPAGDPGQRDAVDPAADPVPNVSHAAPAELEPSGAPPAAAPSASRTTESFTWPTAAGAGVPTVRPTAPNAGGSEPSRHPAPPSLDDLFPNAPVTQRAESAAHTFAAAFANTPPGRPTRAASNELSLDHVFRGAPEAAVGADADGFSFDQFFSDQRPAAEGAVPGARGSEEGGMDAHDIEQFTAWLEGLKKK